MTEQMTSPRRIGPVPETKPEIKAEDLRMCLLGDGSDISFGERLQTVADFKPVKLTWEGKDIGTVLCIAWVGAKLIGCVHDTTGQVQKAIKERHSFNIEIVPAGPDQGRSKVLSIEVGSIIRSPAGGGLGG